MDKIAFLFSGQGAQKVGMGKELYDSSDISKELFEKASKYIPNIKEICFDSDIETLSKTINCQPALFMVSLASAYHLKSIGIVPDYVAGFSLGEIPALVYASVLSFEDGIKLVQKRAEAMEVEVKKTAGGMAAVLNISLEEVKNVLKQFENVFVANENCETQTVISGEKEQLQKVLDYFKENKIRALPLRTEGAFHTKFMEGASQEVFNFLETLTLNKEETPIYSNCTGELYQGEYKTLISNQISSGVKWLDIMKDLESKGVCHYIEVGSGNVLTGLAKKIVTNANTYEISGMNSIDEVKNVFK